MRVQVRDSAQSAHGKTVFRTRVATRPRAGEDCVLVEAWPLRADGVVHAADGTPCSLFPICLGRHAALKITMYLACGECIVSRHSGV